MKLTFDIDPFEPEPDFIGPRIPACKIEDHDWTLVIEDGRAALECLNPCSEERKRTMDMERHGPMCDVIHEFIDLMHMEAIPVRPVIETEYTPGEFGGQGDTDAWLVVHPC